MNNPLSSIPDRYRQLLYTALFLAGVVVGALNVAGVSTGKAIDVVAYLGSALGLVARSNMNQPEQQVPEDQ